MGLNTGSLTTILLGFGLGILALSCLTVTAVFGRYVNKSNEIAFFKYKRILSLSLENSMIDSSIAIAVLGCISAALSITAIILSFLIKGKSIFLIIFGGIASIFAFGCIVAEGVYTKQSFENAVYDEYGQLKDYQKSHNGVIKYIKNSIEKLYVQAKRNIEDYAKEESIKESDVSIPSWSDIKNLLGKMNDKLGRVVTYNDIWTTSFSESDEIPMIIYLGENGIIYAQYKKGDITTAPVKVATCRFNTQFSNQRTINACYFTNNDNSSFECSILKGETIHDDINITITKNQDDSDDPYSYDRPNLFNQYVVVGHYYSKFEKDTQAISVNYLVNNFPFAFKLLQEYKEFKDVSRPLAEDSSNHYKVSAKKWIKALTDYYSQDFDTEDKLRKQLYYAVPSKPSNYNDAINKCEQFLIDKKKKIDEGIERGEFDNYFCINGTSSELQIYKDYLTESDVATLIHYYSTDYNSGKIHQFFKNHLKSEAKEYMNSLSTYPGLYEVALINLIIQIFGIIFWACGTFIPTNDNNDEMPSEGEA